MSWVSMSGFDCKVDSNEHADAIVSSLSSETQTAWGTMFESGVENNGVAAKSTAGEEIVVRIRTAIRTDNAWPEGGDDANTYVNSMFSTYKAAVSSLPGITCGSLSGSQREV